MDLQALRKEYTVGGLDESDLADDPIEQFQRWFGQAKRTDLVEPNGMTLATVGPDGMPSARTVLLKDADPRGLVFYTNYASRKARELEAGGKAALLFWWPPLERQVRFEGHIERVEATESERYFASRPRGARIGAWASAQSQPIASRAALEEAVARYAAHFGDRDVPRPEHWGGYRLVPRRVEFWQGRADRLHDRLVYQRTDQQTWRIERLSP